MNPEISFDMTPCKFRQPDVPENRLAHVYSVELALWRRPLPGDDPRYYPPRGDGAVRKDVSWNGVRFPEPLVLSDAVADVERMCASWLERWVAQHQTDPLLPRSLEVVERPLATVKLAQVSEWWCTWFQHECLDVGQDDADAVASFGRYVRWVRSLPRRRLGSGLELDAICLMGAEDRWRWRSGSDDYEGVPCRCAACKSQGVLRIAH